VRYSQQFLLYLADRRTDSGEKHNLLLLTEVKTYRMYLKFRFVQVMIIIVVIFLVCQTPAFVNQLVYVIGVEDSCGLPYFYYYHFSNIIVSANSAVNFVVYCVFRRQFRRRLREFCGCGDERQDSRPPEPWPPNMKSSITNQSPQSHSCNRHIKFGLVQLSLEHGNAG